MLLWGIMRLGIYNTMAIRVMATSIICTGRKLLTSTMDVAHI